jgi:hypothetical protein
MGSISLLVASWSSYWLYRRAGHLALSYCHDQTAPYAIADEAISCHNYNEAAFVLKLGLVLCILSFIVSYVLAKKNAKQL